MTFDVTVEAFDCRVRDAVGTWGGCVSVLQKGECTHIITGLFVVLLSALVLFGGRFVV